MKYSPSRVPILPNLSIQISPYIWISNPKSCSNNLLEFRPGVYNGVRNTPLVQNYKSFGKKIVHNYKLVYDLNKTLILLSTIFFKTSIKDN